MFSVWVNSLLKTRNYEKNTILFKTRRRSLNLIPKIWSGVKIGAATDAALDQIIMALYKHFNLEIFIKCILQDYSNVGIETLFCFSGSVKSVKIKQT